MDTTENKTEQYKPFGPEWEKEVMKSSKSVIVQMFKNCAIQCLQLSTVNKPSPPTVEHLNELYELSDEPIIQGNEYYLRGFKDRENYSPPMEVKDVELWVSV